MSDVVRIMEKMKATSRAKELSGGWGEMAELLFCFKTQKRHVQCGHLSTDLKEVREERFSTPSLWW